VVILTVECDPAAVTLTNGDIQTDRYYRGDNLLYSCDDGYTKTTDPVCTESGNWSHDPGCLLVRDGGSTDVTNSQLYPKSQRGKYC